MGIVSDRSWGRGMGKTRSGKRLRRRLGVEVLEDRSLLAAMNFPLVDDTGLDPSKFRIYALGSNFKTGDGAWYMDSTGAFVSGTPGDVLTSHRVGSGDGLISTITVPDADIQGARIYFFVVPTGSVAGATVTDGSLGYTSVPNVTFPEPAAGGIRATGRAVLGAVPDPVTGKTTNAVASIVIDNPGSGYTAAPVPTIDAPGAIGSVTLVTGGSGYKGGGDGTDPFAISGGSSLAGATAHITGGVVTSVTLDARGSGYGATVQSPQKIDNIPSTTVATVDVTLQPAATATSTLFGGSGPTVAYPAQPTNPPGYPFVYQIVEFTSVQGEANTVDIQTVDGFTMPLTITYGSDARINEPGRQYGQPIATVTAPANAAVTRAAILESYDAFMQGLGNVGAPYLALPFTLDIGEVDGQRGGILSPDAYLTAQSATGDYLNLGSLLDTAFDAQLATLFSSATSGPGGQLSLQGQGAQPQAYTGVYAAAVAYPGPKGQTPVAVPTSGTGKPILHPAITFTGETDAARVFNVFNPIGLSRLADDHGNPLSGVISAVDADTVTLQLDRPLPSTVEEGWFVYGSGLTKASGNNQSAPITPWYVKQVLPGGKTVSLGYYDGNGSVSGSAVVTTVPAQYQFSKLPYVSMMLTPGQMAFGNSGVFADNDLQYLQNSDDAAVVGNLEYQVVAALNRGVTFAAGARGATGGGTSSAWFDESGWYPAGKTQNLFSYFMHVGTVEDPQSGGKVPIFSWPENPAQIDGFFGPATMGSAYGFPFDETPGSGSAQVPSKFDGNIVEEGGEPANIIVTFGPWGTVTPVTDPTVQAPATFTIYTETGPLDWSKGGKPLDVILNVPADEVVLVTLSAQPSVTVPSPKFTWTPAAGVAATLVTGDSVVYLQGTKAAIVAALEQAVAPLGFDYSVIPPQNAAVNLTISGWRKPAASWTPFDTAFSVVDNLPVFPLIVDLPTAPQAAALDQTVTLALPYETFADTDPAANVHHVAIFSVSGSGSGTGEFGYAARSSGPSVTSWNSTGPMSGPSDGAPQSISFFGTIAQINHFVTSDGIQFKPTKTGASRIDVTLLRLAVSSTTGGWIVVDSETKEMTVTTEVG